MTLKFSCILTVTFQLICALPDKHPVLFYDQADVPELQLKARTTHARIAASIKAAGNDLKTKQKFFMPPESHEKFASSWNEMYGNWLGTFALYCVLYPEDQEALELVKQFMDRMASYPDWYVAASRGKDQMPISHSLTGFAVAFDFLYPSLSDERRKIYLEKIRSTTAHLYQLLMNKNWGWTKQYIHNHSPINVGAMLLGAIVCELHEEKPEATASIWKKAAIEHLDRGLEILAYVTDGTSDEGLRYGSYTSRCWTQYAFLAKRHFNKDHTNNPWFQQHFWFFYGTVLPGYQRTVGIGDANHNWFHGPESQLVFLDAFVLKNGYGNWLADRIRESRSTELPLAQTPDQVYTTTHTEFLFYNASIKPVAPRLPADNQLSFYSDWGVVTYGAAPRHSEKNTFLSMKSGAIHGEGVADIVERNLFSSFTKGWYNFNAGHEHPDQNSFTFAPYGKYFITEALYSVKQTYLNNVLMFAPYSKSECNAPWVGQMGECSKWLNWKFKPVPRGKIVSASQSGNMVHIIGEAAQAYSSDLGLKSVQRSMVLLQPEVLVVLDSVYLHEQSELTHASAFFHNILHPFQPYHQGSFQGAQVRLSDGFYSIFWLDPNGNSPTASLHNETVGTEYIIRTTSYVNVTYGLNSRGVTHMAYIFFGPNVKVDASLSTSAKNSDVTKIIVTINDDEYAISLASLMTSLKVRLNCFGFGSYVQVRTPTKTVAFGAGDNDVIIDRCDVNDDDVVRALISSHNKSELQEKSFTSPSDDNIHSKLSIIGICGIVSIGCLVVFKLGRFCKKSRLNSMKLAFATIGLFVVWEMCYSLIIVVNATNDKNKRLVASDTCNISHPVEQPLSDQAPTVFITSLPSSGAELLGELFHNSTDFLYLTTDDVTIPVPDQEVTKGQSCYWPVNGQEVHPRTVGWFSTIVSEPLLFLNNLSDRNQQVQHVRRKFRELNKNPTFAINLLSGFWNTKLAWIHNLKPKESRFLLVVRDPRDWVYALTRDDLAAKSKEMQQHIVEQILSAEKSNCRAPSVLAWESKQVKRHMVSSTVERLANQWAANVATMLRTARSVQVVRFEDLVADPEFASREIMRRLGTTVSLPQISRLTRAVRSGYHSFNFEPPLREDSTQEWKDKLSASDARTIEGICWNIMKKLMYF